MSARISELIARRDALDRQIREARALECSNAITQVRRLMSEHGLSVEDLALSVIKHPSIGSRAKVAPKYLDPASGAMWSGRGLKPRWLAAALQSGRLLSDFAIS